MTNESRACEDLGRDAELFRLIVESASDFAIFTTDRASRITTWSTGAERLLGFSEAEVLGQDSRILFTPEDRERGDPEWEMEEALGRDRAVNERWHVRKDGSRFFASGLTMTLKDGPSGPRGFVKIFRDITEQKRAEERLRRALDAPTVGVLFFRLDGLILDANPAFERMSGYTAEELRGLPDWMAITVPEHREATARVAAELAERGETAPYEKEMLRKDGSRWWGLFAPTRLSGTGRDSECVEFITDISDRKELERSLHHRVRDLAEADRKKNEFLAMLAHELRNPLAAITSAVRLAQRGGLEMEITFAHQVIERQAGNLARLIDDLLDVSRITQGKVELKREVVDVPAAIHRAAGAVRPLIEQRRHELTVQLTGGPMHVDADPTRLEQILGNLLTNAAKYTEEGGLITISARKRGGQVVIAVKDTGVGISPEMLPKVFDLFTQVDPTLARTEGGLGIGLTLVKQLVEMHGGTIEATSEVGKGSEFTIRLPLVSEASEEEQPKGRDVSGGGRRLLIVDDNADTARLTGRILGSMGFVVHTVHDGRAAIEAAREHCPEVVLLDIGLPGMNGYEVARQLRREEFCRETLIIGVSGYGDSQAREEAREAGFDHHLVKPVDIDSILSLIGGSTDRT